MGVLATIAIRHAQAHYKPAKNENVKTKLPSSDEIIPTNIKAQLLKASQDQFQTVLQHSAVEFQKDLQTTAERINDLIKRLATVIVSDELERYRLDLTKLHNQAEVDISGIKKELGAHENELKAKLAQELESEKQRMIKQIDTKLSDAVGSFLVETLQHNIDLGSQTPYLVALLEEHKADFLKEVTDET